MESVSFSSVVGADTSHPLPMVLDLTVFLALVYR